MRTTGSNQRGETVLSYVRWVMVRKRDRNGRRQPRLVPDLPKGVPAEALQLPARIDLAGYDSAARGQLALLG